MISLLPYNTFHLDVQTRELISISSSQQLMDLARSGYLAGALEDQLCLILGGGSNILFIQDRDGIVLLNQIQGKEILTQDDETVTIKVGGGENWHELVMRTVQQGRRGIENLALIPGSVGAAPVQNIGAYGVEAKDSILSVSGVDLSDGESFELSNVQCQLGYRDSVFKHPGYENSFITHVTWKLSKIPHPKLGYADITKKIEIGHIDLTMLTSHDIAQMIVEIRQSKLPDRTQIGTAGSFFKNPIVSIQTSDSLTSQYPTMPLYPIDDTQVKLSAGRLIDQCGRKNVQHGAVGTYEKHALVLVHHGGGTGQQLWDFAQQIIQSVWEKFGVRIQPEVKVIQQTNH